MRQEGSVGIREIVVTINTAKRLDLSSFLVWKLGRKKLEYLVNLSPLTNRCHKEIEMEMKEVKWGTFRAIVDCHHAKQKVSTVRGARITTFFTNLCPLLGQMISYPQGNRDKVRYLIPAK